MSKTQAVGLQRKTLDITKNFFDDIDALDRENIDTYQMGIAVKVKEFFYAMDEGGIKELAELLEKHSFINTDPAKQAKYTDAFDCLVAFIVAEYNESDLLRYFLPEKYSVEAKPKKEFNSSLIVYWVKFVAYWLGSALFNRRKFTIKEDQADVSSAIQDIKQKLRLDGANYFDLHRKDQVFNDNLQIVVGKFVENRNLVLNSPEETIASTSAQSTTPPSPAASSTLATESSTSSPSVAELPVNNRGNTSDQKSTVEGNVEEIGMPPAVILQSPPPPPPPPVEVEQKPPAAAIPLPTPPPAGKSNAYISFPKVSEPPASTANNTRDGLLIAIRNGIQLKSVSNQKSPGSNDINPGINDQGVLKALVEAACKRRRKAIGPELESLDKNDESEEWDGEDVPDGPAPAPKCFLELDSQAQKDRMMDILESNIPQEVSVGTVGEIINQVELAFDNVYFKKNKPSINSTLFPSTGNDETQQGEDNFSISFPKNSPKN